jgi:hypothetical protein
MRLEGREAQLQVPQHDVVLQGKPAHRVKRVAALLLLLR